METLFLMAPWGMSPSASPRPEVNSRLGQGQRCLLRWVWS